MPPNMEPEEFMAVVLGEGVTEQDEKGGSQGAGDTVERG